MTAEEMHEKIRQEKKEAKEAYRRHLKRATAGIDKT
jgi:hypothetical protein